MVLEKGLVHARLDDLEEFGHVLLLELLFAHGLQVLSVLPELQQGLCLQPLDGWLYLHAADALLLAFFF